MKLTKAQKEGIQEWLDIESEDQVLFCPFDDPLSFCDVCAEMFPTLAGKRAKFGGRCPCRHYPLTYVRRVARRAIS